MQSYGMTIRVIGAKPGQASAVKMFPQHLHEGTAVPLLEMLTATHRYGVDEVVLGSIAESLDGIPFLEPHGFR